jgi:hypothetical protein
METPEPSCHHPSLWIAIAACGSSSPQIAGVGATTATGSASPIALSKCMRSHGVPNFPDPAFPAGGGVIVQLPPGETPKSPAFQAAAQACGGSGNHVVP